MNCDAITYHHISILLMFGMTYAQMGFMNYTGKTSTSLLLTFLILISGFILSSNSSEATVIIGQVADRTGNPIAGASVVAAIDTISPVGVASNFEGIFRLQITDSPTHTLILEVSSIGYHSYQTRIELNQDTVRIDFKLSEKPLEVASISVSPPKKTASRKKTLSQSEIFQSSQYSLVPTNPTSALKQPGISRVGSSQSSKIRVNGTSPRYYLNGASIGQDPNHYGAFSIIPASVVKRISFHPRGTTARFGLPTVIEMETPQAFDTPLKGDLNLSFIEMTGTVAVGNSNFYTLAAIRKSVLDKLVDNLDLESKQATIPPTNFRDIFISSGMRLSDRFNLMLDQFHIGDFLEYNIAQASANPGGVSTFQNTRKNYWGLRLEGISGSLLIKLRAAATLSYEKYKAASGSTGGLFVDLTGTKNSMMFSGDFQLFQGATKLQWGGEAEYTGRRQIDMEQNNWNFLPPDATNDNPYLYQEELNRLYAKYNLKKKDMRGAAYLTLKRKIGRFEIEPGIRLEYFKGLVQPTVVTFRQSVRYKIDDSRNFNFFVGSYAESPTGEILEAYQVLIYDNQQSLKPVSTFLVSLGYGHGPFSAEIYYKQMSNLPITLLDYNQVDKSAGAQDGFVSVGSRGSLDFTGVEISFDKENIASGLIDLYGFYSYSRADKINGSNNVPYELNATHNFFNQIRYKAGTNWSLSGEISVRSGYSYTPTLPLQVIMAENRYDKAYYDDVMSSENSRQFPTHISFNLGGEIRMGKIQLFMALSNITNHDNAIINTRSGYVYDMGILPSIGMKYSF